MSDDTLLAEFLNDLGTHADGDLRTDQYSRILYSTDASIYQVMPHGVFFPQSNEDVQAAVELAARYKVPLIARTAGSSLAGQAVGEALIMDFTRHLDQVLDLNVEEHWVRVQPGIVLDALNIHLRPHGLQFGPDPASSNRAAMGGITSNNSTGAHSILYGMTADHVLEMNVLLDDGSAAHFRPLDWQDAANGATELDRFLGKSGREGEIYRQMNTLVTNPANQAIIAAHTPRQWRRCGGYNLDRFVDDPALNWKWAHDTRFNLAKIISGAEGTLGVITDLTLNLVPLPKMTALAIVHFDNLHTALSAVPVMLEVEPSAIELLDNLGLTMCRDVPEYSRLLETFLHGRPNCVLITEFYGESEAELREKVARLEAHIEKQRVGATAVTRAFEPALQANVWTVRKVGLGLMMSIKGDHKPIPFIEDAAVQPEHLAEYVTRLETFCNDLGTQVAYYAHASAGCIHIRPLINQKTASDVAKMPQILSFAVEMLGDYGGSLSSEHGDGRARSWMNEHFFGPELYGLYRQVKQIFDPQGIFNPGNVVDAGPMTENLRYGAEYQAIQLTPHLDFSEDGGFDRAVEMCNGAGICRKRTTGTMCPSFMATREEEHSTRGRANLLRAALSGKLPPEELTGPRIYEAMDLCIECKACKAECPSAVDMAKIKFEYLSQYYETNGVPLRAKLFANIGGLSAAGSGTKSLAANWVVQNGLMLFVRPMLGITNKRPLPMLARNPLPAWFRKHKTENGNRKPENGSALPKIALFHDPFTNYNQPEVGIAAVEFLEAAGYDVIWPDHKGDGRPFISKGLVAEAKHMADETLSMLVPLAEQGIPIVGLEPSSLLTLRDDYFFLLPGDPRVPLVAEHAYTFEEFVARLADEDQLDLTFTEDAAHILLHGHCHQKALVGTGPAVRALTLPPNYTLTEVDSGCCGMAGSFGYEAEHYDISMRMAEQRLLPAVREASYETIVVAAGISCRQQIKHGANRQALHPAQVLRNAILVE